MPLRQFIQALFIVGFCLAGVVAVIAASRPPQDQPPTFRAGVQYIEIDVRVTDSDGRFVRGLTKDDFVLLEDGKPQTISTSTFVDLERESPVTRHVPGTLEPDVATNAGGGRMWVMLLGGYAQRARLVARRFVEEALGPNDEVAVVLVNGNMSSAQGFTRKRQLLLASIDRLQSDSPEEFVGDPVVRAFQVLEELCVRLGRIGGSRKAVLYFDPPGLFIDTSPRGPQRMFAQRDALRAATRNNVAIYVVSTSGLGTEMGLEALSAMGGQRLLAEETGGDAIVNSNNFEDGYQRFVRETNKYYLLGYTPSVEHRDDRFHQLAVRVNRPGVTVRARQGYYAAKADAAESGGKPEPNAPDLSADAQDALRLPLSMNGLTIDLATAPFRGVNGRGSVLLSARVRGDALVLGAGELMEVGFRATTTEGKTTPGAFHVIKLDLTERSREAAQSSGLQFVDWMSLPAGRHQVRFVVHQPNGKTGMVVGDVDVPDFKATVSMSGVVLASSRLSAQPPLKMDEPLRKILGAHPTAERTFARSDTVTAYAELYTNGRPDATSATIAPATQLNRSRPVDVALSFLDQSRFGALARLPVRELQVGDYVLTFDTRVGRQSARRQVVLSVTER